MVAVMKPTLADPIGASGGGHGRLSNRRESLHP
jgi:hypothetical protein